jgi:cytoskeletal protein CcmA (bactofilin family)
MALFTKDASSSPQKPSPPPREPQSSGATSFIGTNLVVEGTISGKESLVLEGTVKGEVNLQSDLRIGATARIEAKVHAKNIIIEGTLVGDASAENKIELQKGSSIDGNIKAPKIVIAEGAKFRGAVDMGSDKGRE